MTAEIAAYSPPAQSEIEYTWNLANKLCKTEFVPANLRNKPEAVLAVFLTGRELGIGPMQSLRDIYPVNGRPALMASLMVARVRALGHKFTTIKSTDTEATVQIHRREEAEPQPPVAFTQADARRAGLFDKAVWKQYPTAMHWNRAASAACRRDCPEALGGAVYTPEEIEDGQGSTTATWGSPEGPPLSDEPSDQTPGPAPQPPRGQAGSGPMSEADMEAGNARTPPAGQSASDLNASVTEPGDTGVSPGQEPLNAEAPTPPASPGDDRPGRGKREPGTGKPGNRTPAGPQRTTGRGAATDATSSVKQAGSVNPGEGEADPSLLPEPPGWEP